MSDEQQTPTPWARAEDISMWPQLHEALAASALPYRVVENRDGLVATITVGDTEAEAEANARRIVACVNFCEGRATEALERAGPEGLLPTAEWLAL
jgi:hypothetical protein